MEPITTVMSTIAAAPALLNTIKSLYTSSKEIGSDIKDDINNVVDAGIVSLPAFTKPLRLCSRVYIDDTIFSDPIITDVIKTVHTQYAAFILTALQMNRFITNNRTVSNMLKVVATEDNQIHISVMEALDPNIAIRRAELDEERAERERKREKREEEKHILDLKRIAEQAKREAEKATREAEKATRDAEKATSDKTRDATRELNEAARAKREEERAINEATRAKREEEKARSDKIEREKVEAEAVSLRKARSQTLNGKVVSLAGDNHVPAGKLLEITLANPDNPSVNVTLTLMVQLAPYRVPEQLAVAMITKDVIPTFFQRMLQWRTSEISFWRDFVFMSDIVEHREKLMKMDPTGILADQIGKQTQGRQRVLSNVTNPDKASRARNIANSVLIFSRETMQRAAAESGVNITEGPMGVIDAAARQKFFATSFAMIMVVVDPLYNQATFYYNGLDDAAVFSFDQLQVSSKGDRGLDLASVMNALGQGRSPKF